METRSLFPDLEFGGKAPAVRCGAARLLDRSAALHRLQQNSADVAIPYRYLQGIGIIATMSWTHEAFLSEDSAVKSDGKRGFRKGPPVRRPSMKALVVNALGGGFDSEEIDIP